MTAALFAAVLGAVAIAATIRLPPLHPAQLWSIPWAVASGLFALRLLPYRSIGWMTVLIGIGATVTFAAGTILGERLAGRGKGSTSEGAPVGAELVPQAAVTCVVLTLVWLGAFLAQAINIYGVRATLVSSFTVRDAITEGVFPLTIKYVYPALAAVALCAMAAGLAQGRESRAKWAGTAGACAASLYFSTGRSTIIIAVVLGGVAYAIACGRPISKARFLAGIAAVAVAALLIFMAGGVIIGKTYENNRELQRLPSVFSHHSAVSSLSLPYLYATAPIAGLDIQIRVSSTWGDAHGCATLSEVCRGIRTAGVDAPPIQRVRPFSAPPLAWNTYTALDVPLLDGGKALTVPFVGLLGVLCGFVWGVARGGSLIGILAYPILAGSIVSASAIFNFSAPHLVGAFLIAALALVLAAVARSRALPTG